MDNLIKDIIINGETHSPYVNEEGLWVPYINENHSVSYMLISKEICRDLLNLILKDAYGECKKAPQIGEINIVPL